jgi:hypothetical protein
MANEVRHYLKLQSEPRGVLTESHPASAGLPTFVAGRQKWVWSLGAKHPNTKKQSKNIIFYPTTQTQSMKKIK